MDSTKEKTPRTHPHDGNGSHGDSAVGCMSGVDALESILMNKPSVEALLRERETFMELCYMSGIDYYSFRERWQRIEAHVSDKEAKVKAGVYVAENYGSIAAQVDNQNVKMAPPPQPAPVPLANTRQEQINDNKPTDNSYFPWTSSTTS